MKQQILWYAGCLMVCALCLTGCATTRYEEVGSPPTADIAQLSLVETVPLLQQRMKDLEERVARIEAELAGRFSGLEASQGELTTRLMSLSEQIEMISRQLQGTSGMAKPASDVMTSAKDLSQLYEQGLSAYYDRRYGEAQEKFERYLKLMPKGELVDNAQYWAGECEYGKKNYQAAIDAFQKVSKFAKTEKDDDAQFMIGQCYYNLGNLENALVEFNRLKIDYPDSEYQGRVEAYIEKIRAAQDASQ